MLDVVGSGDSGIPVVGVYPMGWVDFLLSLSPLREGPWAALSLAWFASLLLIFACVCLWHALDSWAGVGVEPAVANRVSAPVGGVGFFSHVLRPARETK